jgi:hypothetical protein
VLLYLIGTSVADAIKYQFTPFEFIRSQPLSEGSNGGPTRTIATGLQVALTSAVAAVIGAALTFAGVYYTGWFNYASKDEELRVQLVQIAVGILKIKQEDGEAQPRNWAIDVMEKNTGVKMQDEERKLLVKLGGLKGAPTSAPLGIGNKSSTIEVPTSNGNFLSCYYNETTGSYDTCVPMPKR